MNIHIYFFGWIYVFSPFEYIHMSGLVGSHGNSVFNLLRIYPTSTMAVPSSILISSLKGNGDLGAKCVSHTGISQNFLSGMSLSVE